MRQDMIDELINKYEVTRAAINGFKGHQAV